VRPAAERGEAAHVEEVAAAEPARATGGLVQVIGDPLDPCASPRFCGWLASFEFGLARARSGWKALAQTGFQAPIAWPAPGRPTLTMADCTTLTLGSMAATQTRAGGRGWPSSDEAMYAAVARAWCRLADPRERLESPLGQYVLSPGFVHSVAGAPVDGWLVAELCARLVRQDPLKRCYRNSSPLTQASLAEDDPFATWWCALQGPGGLGVHYDERAYGSLVFLSVAARDDVPAWNPVRV
jgi:hypothetical protein